jgi:hypothetical protein
VSIATSLISQGYLSMFETTVTAPSVNMQSGSLVGGGTIEGSLTNNGFLGPANAETLTVTGNYTQMAGGELSVNGFGYPVALVVKSNASLSGTLSVGVNLKRPPAKGSTWTAMTFGSLSGEFTSFTVEGGGTVQYTNDSVVVTFHFNNWCGPPKSCRTKPTGRSSRVAPFSLVCVAQRATEMQSISRGPPTENKGTCHPSTSPSGSRNVCRLPRFMAIHVTITDAIEKAKLILEKIDEQWPATSDTRA